MKSLIKSLTLASLVIAALTSCASIPAKDLASADFGAPPELYAERIKAYFAVDESTYALNVKPDWRFGEPYKAAYKPRDGNAWQFGYGVDMRFNRKRRYQGYDFGQKHRFFFHDTTMKHIDSGEELRQVSP